MSPISPRLALALLCAWPVSSSPAVAQLVSERLEEGRRICTYFGSELSREGEAMERTVIVGFGEECPGIAPPRASADSPPPNAALIREVSDASGRSCFYAQGGREYLQRVALSERCAMTPALQQRR